MTPSELRDFIETDLADGALETIIAAELEAIEQRAPSARVERFQTFGRPVLSLADDIDAITRVTVRRSSTAAETVLAPNDYRLDPPRSLVRLSTGENPASQWVGRIVVEYAPAVRDALRKRVLIDLCKLAVEFRGVQSERVGDVAVELGDYQAQREAILGALDGTRVLRA